MNETEIKIFKSQEFGSIRTIEDSDEPWFVGKDVCEAFGDTNYRRSLGNIDDCDKRISQIETAGGMQNMTIINESGLYSLLFQMHPQKARGVSQSEHPINERIEKLHRFKRWVTAEVLPAIRKNGGYIAGQETMTDDEILAKALLVAQNKIAERDRIIEEKQRLIGELQPKANYVDTILQSKSLVLTTQIAKDYGMSARRLNQILKEMRIQYKVGGQWVLYSKYQSNGYVHSRTINITRANGESDTTMQTEWTQKGRLFLYEALKKKAYVPVIEQAEGSEE